VTVAHIPILRFIHGIFIEFCQELFRLYFIFNKRGTKMAKQKLLDQVRAAIRVRHMSYRTEQTYVDWIRRFILFHNKRHPNEMDESHVSRFLTHLAVNRHVASSTQNQALCAILFLYREVLKKEIGWVNNVERAKRRETIPVVFTKGEAEAVLLQLEGTKWLMASLLYGSGLRLMECLRLP
jgi:site-specific recombinase XerD